MPNPEIDHVEIKGTTYDVAGSGGAVTSVNGQTGTVVLDADDVGALPDDTSIPSKTSDLTNDSGFITSSSVPTKTSDLTNDSGFITTETDPTVPSWAKASTKPSYTAQEVGALPSSTSIPSKTSDLNNDSGFITSSSLPTKVSDLQNDENFIDASGAPVQSVNGQTGTVSISIPDSTSDLVNDSGFVSSAQTEKIFVQGTTPSTASDGDIWIDTATQSASGIAYLPLTAGVDHPLSGPIYLTNNGIVVGKISTESNGLALEGIDSNGDAKGSVFINNSNGGVFVRPNGISDGTNEVNFLNGNIGGAKFFHNSTFGAGHIYRMGNVCIMHVNMSVNFSGWSVATWNTIGTYTNIPLPTDSNVYGVGKGYATSGNVSGPHVNLRLSSAGVLSGAIDGTASTWGVNGILIYWTTT